MRFKQHGLIISLSIVVLLSLMAVSVAAQEEAPPEVIGDADAESLQVVQEYLETRDPNLLAEDVEYSDQTQPGPVIGRDTVAQVQADFYSTAFSATTIEPYRFITAEDTVVAEFLFEGVNTGPYLDYPATNAQVSLPMVGIYQVDEGQIHSARMYYDAATLQAQLGIDYGVGGGVGVAVPGNTLGPNATQDMETLNAIATDPVAYEGEQVAVEGLVGEAVTDRAFVLREDGFLGSGEVLVIDSTEGGLEFAQVADTRVRIEGSVQPFDMAMLEAETGVDIDDAALANYQSLPVIIASSAANLDPVENLSTILQNPQAFYDQQITIEGNVGEAITPNTFILYQDGLLSEPNRLLVVKANEGGLDFIQLADTRIRIQGILYASDFARIEETVEFDLDEEALAEYEALPVLVATAASNLENVETLQAIIDNPEAFYGQTVTVTGLTGDMVSSRSAFLNTEQLIGSQRLLVIGTEQNAFEAAQPAETRFAVTGTVQPFVQVEIESQYGFDLSEADYSAYENTPVIIASQVTAIE